MKPTVSTETEVVQVPRTVSTATMGTQEISLPKPTLVMQVCALCMCCECIRRPAHLQHANKLLASTCAGSLQRNRLLLQALTSSHCEHSPTGPGAAEAQRQSGEADGAAKLALMHALTVLHCCTRFPLQDQVLLKPSFKVEKQMVQRNVTVQVG